MSNFKVIVTNEGKHPAYKWAEVTADDIIDISAMSQSPKTLMKEAMDFRIDLVKLLTEHHQHVMDEEANGCKHEDRDLDGDYDSEDFAIAVTDDILDMVKGKSFEDHFKQDHVRAHINGVCNKYFKSAMLVERQFHHAAKKSHAAKAPAVRRKGKK